MQKGHQQTADLMCQLSLTASLGAAAAGEERSCYPGGTRVQLLATTQLRFFAHKIINFRLRGHTTVASLAHLPVTSSVRTVRGRDGHTFRATSMARPPLRTLPFSVRVRWKKTRVEAAAAYEVREARKGRRCSNDSV